MRNTKNTNQKGAAAAEFVIVLPLLIILLFMIVQFGFVLNRVQTFNAAAREGARVASLPDTDQGEISTAVNNALAGLTLGINPAITTTPGSNKPCNGAPLGSTVTVEVSGPYTIQIPLLPDRNVTLSGTGVFRCE